MGEARLSGGSGAPLIDIVIFSITQNGKPREFPATAELFDGKIKSVAHLKPALRIALELLVAFAIVMIAHPAAFAHAYLVKSIPAQRAVLLRAPAKVQLWFNEPLEPRYSGLSIIDSTGKNISITHVEIGGADPKLISATVDALPAGTYVIKFRVLSVDGHIAENQFPFTIKR